MLFTRKTGEQQEGVHIAKTKKVRQTVRGENIVSIKAELLDSVGITPGCTPIQVFAEKGRIVIERLEGCI